MRCHRRFTEVDTFPLILLYFSPPLRALSLLPLLLLLLGQSSHTSMATVSEGKTSTDGAE